MRINLLDVPVYFINLEKDIDNKKHTAGLLKKLGFKNVQRVPGFLNDNPVVGCSQAHYNILKSKINYDGPFIVLEDDIEVRHLDHIVELPDDADALYLGVSAMGSYGGKDYRQISGEKVDGYSPEIYKIYNMLAAHAILYKSKEYIEHVLRIIEFHIDTKTPHDIGIAENLKYWNVYCVNKPIFYQKEKYRDLTDTELDKLMVVSKKNSLGLAEDEN
jgi:hypothetical protein